MVFDWYHERLDYVGFGEAVLSGLDTTIHGRAHAWFADDGTGRVEIVCERASGRLAGNFSGLAHAMGVRCDRLTIKTDSGVLVAEHSHEHGGSFGDSGLLYRYKFDRATYTPHVASTAFFWCAPLMNLITAFIDPAPELLNHPLRLAPGTRSVRFTFQSRPAFIEPLPEHESSLIGLSPDRDRRVTSSVLVGEVGGCGTDMSRWTLLLRQGLLLVIGLANGAEVSIPWLEFRASDGALVLRHHVRWNVLAFAPGHQPVRDEVSLHFGSLLTACQSSSLFGDSGRFALFRHLVKAGRESNTIEETFYHLCVILDDLCYREEVDEQYLAKSLPAAVQSDLKEQLKNARQAVLDLATLHTNLTEREKETLRSVADRVLQTTNKAREFGLAVCDLLQLPAYRLFDAEAMAGFAPSSTVPSWPRALSIYRGTIMHGTFFAGRGHDLDLVIRVKQHLHDLVLRLVLKLLGYSGTYRSPISSIKDERLVGWVTPSTTPKEFGY